MSKKSVSLPEIPTGIEFEEFISAYFQAMGMYLDRNIVYKEDSEELLELDIIVSSYVEEIPKKIIIEVKSGNLHLSDVFKLKGWMDFLSEFEEGLFIARGSGRSERNLELIRDKLRINVIAKDNDEEIKQEILGAYAPNIDNRLSMYV